MSNLKLDINSFWVSLMDMRQFFMNHYHEDRNYVCLVWDRTIATWTFHPETVLAVESHAILVPLRNKRGLFADRLLDSRYSVVNPKFFEDGQSFWLTNHTLEDLSSLQIYLTFLLEEYHARFHHKCFVLEHRKIDEKISSNAEIMHFHRLRALFDGVAFSWNDAANGYEYDIDCVEGEAPVKIVLDPEGDLSERIEDIEMFHQGTPTYFIVESQAAFDRLAAVLPVGSDIFIVDQSHHNLPSFLAEKGLNSLLIEGEGLLINSSKFAMAI